MKTGIIHDQNLEKQIEKHRGGCMAGFFNLFDRNHVLSGKRIYTKHLPASRNFDSASDSVSSARSPALQGEFERPQPVKSAPSPDRLRPPATPSPEPAIGIQDPAPAMSSPSRAQVAVTSFDFKEGLKSPWKFSREAPRLSLDSRAIVDAKGKLHPREIRTTVSGGGPCDGYIRSAGDDESERQRRPPSVIARLMGLDQPLPSSHSGAGELPEKKAELQRSSSESRSRDMYRFFDGNVFPATHRFQSNSVFATNNARENFASTDARENNSRGREFNHTENLQANRRLNIRTLNHGGYIDRSANTGPAKPWTPPQQRQRKGMYDAGDFFPEPKPAVSVYGEIEKRLKMRGMEEPSKDLETLKQIFEALKLRSLLHSKQPQYDIGRRTCVYERKFPGEESPIVVMKPARSPRRLANEPSPPPGFRAKAISRRNPSVVGGDSLPSASPRRDRPEMIRSTWSQIRNPNPSSPGRSENRNSSPVTTRKRLGVDTQRRINETTTTEPRRVSPVQSPRNGSWRMDQTSSQSPRRRRATAEVRGAEDESSTNSESSISSSSHTDTERSKTEDLKDGKSLLERSVKLLDSIAEITATTVTELQPSPVSVLDSSIYKEESSPSPVMKRTIDFNDHVVDLEYEMWSRSSSAAPFQPKSSDTDCNTDDQQDPDFAYVSEVLRALNYLPEESDLFLLLEKHQAIKGRDTSKGSRLKRKLIFDAVIEIQDRNSRLPPWKSSSSGPQLSQIWSELQRIYVRDESEYLYEIICSVMKRDMARDSIHGWGECHVEMSEVVLDIERLVLKDLIGETIRGLAGKSEVVSAPRRKLVF